MKRLITVFALLTLLAVPSVVFQGNVVAQVDPFQDVCEGIPAGGDAPAACSANGNNDPIAGEDGVLLRTVSIVSWVAGAAAVIVIMFAGLKFITANGDPNSISTARNAVIYALIGIAVLAISNLIVRFVISLL